MASTCVTCLWVQTHTECVYMCVCVCWICCHPLVEVGRCGSALDVGLCAILPKFHPLLVPNNDVYHLIYIIDRSQGPRRLISAILARAIFEKYYSAISKRRSLSLSIYILYIYIYFWPTLVMLVVTVLGVPL